MHRWLTALIVLVTLTAIAHADEGENAGPGARLVISYFLALFFTIGALIVICKPSRKA
jgi:hypothetical protein